MHVYVRCMSVHVVHVHRASGERTCCCMASHESVVQASATCSAACRTSERACVCHTFGRQLVCMCMCVVRMQVSQPEAYC